jgi:HEAT repeat protein
MKEVGDLSGLMQLLVHKDTKVRIEAGKALTELRQIESLAHAVSKGDNPQVRVTAAQILKDIGDKDAMEALTNALLGNNINNFWLLPLLIAKR